MNNQKGALSLILVIIIVSIFLFGGFYLLKKTELGIQKNPINQTDTSLVNTETKWLEYKNEKYAYKLQYPRNFTLADYNAASGSFQKPTGSDSKIGIYQDNDPFKNFLEIQVVESQKPLKELAEESYKKNISYPQTKKSTPITLGQTSHSISYSYTITGSVLKTELWEGSLSEENTYNVTFVQKGVNIYAIYFTDPPNPNSTFKQIFSSIEIDDGTIKFDVEKAKIGDKIGEMTITQLSSLKSTAYSSNSAAVQFKGKLTLTGDVSYNPPGGYMMESVCVKNLDDESLSKMPKMISDTRDVWFCFNDLEKAKKSFPEFKKSTFTIDNYLVNYFPISVFNTADLISVVK